MKTIKQAEKYIRDNYGQPRHNIGNLVRACRKVAKQLKVDMEDCFFFMIENKPISGKWTHSYGFHTAEGRGIHDAITSEYYKLQRQ